MPDRYFGKYTGIVKDNRDDANLGRVKVSVPAIFPPNEHMLARPALPYGYFFVPENETKVWVEFEGGDPGLVLWTGVQYVQGEWAAEAKANPPQYRVVKTAAGHLLLFDDKSGEEKVQISDGVHHHVLTLDANGVKVEDGVNGHSVTIDAGGVLVRLKTGAKIQMTESSTSVDAGSGMVEVKGSTVEVTGSMVKLGDGAVPVIRYGDSGVGNLGAPVFMTVTTNTKVLA
jgi:Type VI secretion system/phage-baseplate injector OB domain